MPKNTAHRQARSEENFNFDFRIENQCLKFNSEQCSTLSEQYSTPSEQCSTCSEQ